ncbi:probable polypeptide N-acetylgalactosaminyltransferase 8 [Dromiciops gliroides]|uniref:probable polypeptide N-acetylgalactosaminyltransferase 8 n=1 Tax=Dromiciops gliroides TaxID=33562 RepID=UPI001CC6936F|nr:probable polypeptide N-acetylgalactosaminyltransferase 8 [Dromiciops gliroides]
MGLLFSFLVILVLFIIGIIQKLNTEKPQGKYTLSPSVSDSEEIEHQSPWKMTLYNLEDSTGHTRRQKEMKQPETVTKASRRLEDDRTQAPVAPETRAQEEVEHKPPKKVFPNSVLFQHWGEGLTESQQVLAQELFIQFGYNVYLSNQLPLNRSTKDFRSPRCLEKQYPRQLPTLSVILTLMNEAMSVIHRAIISIISKTPSHLLKEIILVDDFSSNEELKSDLNKQIQLYKKKYPTLLKLIRHTKRRGLTQARLSGYQAATADVVAILDAHVEVNTGWAEPILARIKEDRTVIVSPILDKISFDTLELHQYSMAPIGFDWELWCLFDYMPMDWFFLKDETAPVKSPSVMGVFAANRLFLRMIGSLDAGMMIYGGENVELALRVWQCGGKIEILPCSRIAHLNRATKPYASNLKLFMKRNALRVAEVWMDEYKYMVYFSWNLPLENHGVDYGDVSSRKKLRKKLKCRSFDWYLKNVYPSLNPIPNIVAYGMLRNSLNGNLCIDQGPQQETTPIMFYCHGHESQIVFYSLTGQLYLGKRYEKWHAYFQCLVDFGEGRGPKLVSCSEAAEKGMHIFWDFKQGAAIINRNTKRCMEIKKGPSESYILIFQECTGQSWNIQHTVKNQGIPEAFG